MYTEQQTKQFKKDMKRCKKQGRNMRAFMAVSEQLLQRKPLPPKYRDHALTKNCKGYRDCHIAPDWLLIYQVHDDTDEIDYVRMGSHDDLSSFFDHNR